MEWWHLLFLLVTYALAIFFAYRQGWENGYEEGYDHGMKDSKYYKETFDHIAGGG